MRLILTCQAGSKRNRRGLYRYQDVPKNREKFVVLKPAKVHKTPDRPLLPTQKPGASTVPGFSEPLMDETTPASPPGTRGLPPGKARAAPCGCCAPPRERG